LSTELDKLVKKANERKVKRKSDTQISAKHRVDKAPSKLPIPVGAPDWAYKADWIIPSNDNSPSQNQGQKSIPRQIFSDTSSDDESLSLDSE